MEQLWDETAFTSTNINQKQTDDAYAQLCASVGIGQQNNGMDIPAEAIDRRRIKAVRWLRFWQSVAVVCHQPTISISGWLMTNTVKKRMLQWSSFGTRRHQPKADRCLRPISTKSRLTMLTPSCVPGCRYRSAKQRNGHSGRSYRPSPYQGSTLVAVLAVGSRFVISQPFP